MTEPAAPGADLRLAVPGDVDPLCAMLARTFDDDPVAMAFFHSDRRRPVALRTFFRVMIAKELLRFGAVYTTTTRTGAAVWSPPGHLALQGLRGLWAMLPVGPYLAGNFRNSMRHLAVIEKLHPKEPHWYLATLGVEPSLQGRGLGGALLAPVLAKADRDAMPAYLESSKERNVPFYRRHGFEVTREISGHGFPTIWAMWREPRPPEA